MESHVVARVAAEKKLPFAALRVVADPAHRSLSQSALVGVCVDGRIDRLAALRSVLRRPRDALNLAALAYDALCARAALMKVQRELGRRLEGLRFAHPRAAAPVAPNRPLADRQYHGQGREASGAVRSIRRQHMSGLGLKRTENS
jgi:hypothetical protein